METVSKILFKVWKRHLLKPNYVQIDSSRHLEECIERE